MTLPTPEFVRRWCEHIQPDQLTKTRYFGGWCSRQRTKYQERCRRLLGLSEAEAEDGVAATSLADESQAAESPDAAPTAECPRCPTCRSRSLRLLKCDEKPSWSQVLTHLDARCPDWYAESDYAEQCEWLDREFGISYEDWYLETRIESTIRAAEPGFTQLYLPGLAPVPDFASQSY